MKKYTVLALIFGAALMVSCNSLDNIETQEELAALDASAVLEMAAEAYVDNEFDRAIYYYQSILDLFPDSPEEDAWALYEIGWIYYKKGDNDKAIEYFNMALVAETDTSASQFLAAQMLEKLEAE